MIQIFKRNHATLQVKKISHFFWLSWIFHIVLFGSVLFFHIDSSKKSVKDAFWIQIVTLSTKKHENPPPSLDLAQAMLNPLLRGEGRQKELAIIPPPLTEGGKGEGDKKVFTDEMVEIDYGHAKIVTDQGTKEVNIQDSIIRGENQDLRPVSVVTGEGSIGVLNSMDMNSRSEGHDSAETSRGGKGATNINNTGFLLTRSKKGGAPGNNLGLYVANFRETILERIKRNKTYPFIARKLGIEGDVYIDFFVYPDGSVRDISANGKRTGFTVLEQAAVELIQKASPIKVPPSDKPLSKIGTQILISFKLEGEG